MQPIKKTRAQGAAPSAPGHARILLVDDDERNLMALTEVLKDLAEVVDGDVRPRRAAPAAEGRIRGHPARRLHARHGRLRNRQPDPRKREQTARIPIIFLSAVNKETEHLMRGYAMGAVDYVFKPVDPLMLKSKVSVFVDLYDMRLQVEEKSRAEQELRDANFRAELERLEIARELAESREREAAILQSLPILLYMEPAIASPRRPRIRRRRLCRDDRI